MNHQNQFKFLGKEIFTPMGIAIIVLVSVIAGAGIFYAQHFDTQEKIVKDETFDWKTYQNVEYGFEIKCPQDWKIEFREETPMFLYLEGKNCMLVIAEILEQHIEEKLKTRKEWINQGCSSEQLIINEISFEKITCPKELLSTGVGLGEYYFQRENKYYTISFMDYKEVYSKIHPEQPVSAFIECQKYFDQMLSTFRFIDAE